MSWSAPGSTEAKALQAATRDIPIVFANSSDPVGGGLVDSIAHPLIYYLSRVRRIRSGLVFQPSQNGFEFIPRDRISERHVAVPVANDPV